MDNLIKQNSSITFRIPWGGTCLAGISSSEWWILPSPAGSVNNDEPGSDDYDAHEDSEDDL